MVPLPSDGRRPFDVFEPLCPSRQLFEHLFSRWGLLVLAKLSNGPRRFMALHQEIGGISEKMLTQTLKVLEAEGMVDRYEWKERPPRVEYRLSPKGQRIAAKVEALIGEVYQSLDVQ